MPRDLMMDTLKERFVAKVSRDQQDGCWAWTGAKNMHGYGQIWRDGKMHQAHRVAFELFCGPIPDGMFVCHKCDNPACVRSDHLFLGTHQDNMSDKVSKGRQVANYGNARLGENQIREIKMATGLSQRKLAARYGVSQSHVSDIRSGKNWANV